MHLNPYVEVNREIPSLQVEIEALVCYVGDYAAGLNRHEEELSKKRPGVKETGTVRTQAHGPSKENLLGAGAYQYNRSISTTHRTLKSSVEQKAGEIARRMDPVSRPISRVHMFCNYLVKKIPKKILETLTSAKKNLFSQNC